MKVNSSQSSNHEVPTGYSSPEVHEIGARAMITSLRVQSEITREIHKLDFLPRTRLRTFPTRIFGPLSCLSLHLAARQLVGSRIKARKLLLCELYSGFVLSQIERSGLVYELSLMQLFELDYRLRWISPWFGLQSMSAYTNTRETIIDEIAKSFMGYLEVAGIWEKEDEQLGYDVTARIVSAIRRGILSSLCDMADNNHHPMRKHQLPAGIQLPDIDALAPTVTSKSFTDSEEVVLNRTAQRSSDAQVAV